MQGRKGKEMSDRENTKDLAALTAKAREGDSGAIADLYELSYDKVYVTVKSMIKDDDTVFDIVQDSYMKAFAHLDSFTGGEKFTAWMKTIAANTARDWLKKQRPMLFSELNAGEDMDEPAEARFVDERNENLPEWVMEQAETKRLLGEILEGLPEDQRAAITMFYYEELSVKDIAAAMNCTESAVKSRLLYGRKKVEKEVRALEKKGTRLYGLAGIPFLLWLLRSQEVYAAESADGRILQNLLEQAEKGFPQGGADVVQAAGSAGQAAADAAAQAGNAANYAGQAGQMAQEAAGAAAAGAAAIAAGSAAAGTAGAAAAGLGGLKLGLIIAAAVALVGGSVFGIVKLTNKKDPVPVVVTSHTGSGERLTDAARAESGDDSGPESRPAAPATQVPSAETPEEVTRVPQTTEAPTVPETTKDPGQQALEEALAAYRAILERADSYEFNGPIDIEFDHFDYALVQMQAQDPVPTLLLSKCWGGYYYRARVFQYDPETKSVWQPEDQLAYGMMLMGGFRGGLSLEADGNGLLNSEFASGTGMGEYVRVTLNKGKLQTESQWSGRLDQSGQPEFAEIQWHQLSDLSGFENWSGSAPVPGGIQTTEAGQGGGGPQAVTLPSDGSRIVFAGSVRRFTYDEVVELQGLPDPNAQWSDHHQSFLLLVLDEPQEMMLHRGDEESLRSGTVKVIRLPESLSGYAGTHHIFSIDPWKTYWPTDTSLPLGTPGTGDLKVLD